MFLPAFVQFSGFSSVVLALSVHVKRDDIHTVKVGPYTIGNCGDANADIIATSLQNLAQYVGAVKRDAASSLLLPSPAISTFFKSKSSAAYVSKILGNVTLGPAMYEENYYSNGAPIFACLNAPKQMAITAYDHGENSDPFDICTKDPLTNIFTLSGTPYIVVCPGFFTGGASGIAYKTEVPAPTSKEATNYCPTLNPATNRFRGNGIDFATTTPWLLLKVIAQYFIDASQDLPIGDVYDINKSLDLTPAQSMLNAQSYIYYVATVYGNCKSLPTPNPSNITTPNLPNPSDPDDSPTRDATYPAKHLDWNITNVQFGPRKIWAYRYYRVKPTKDYTWTI